MEMRRISDEAWQAELARKRTKATWYGLLAVLLIGGAGDLAIRIFLGEPVARIFPPLYGFPFLFSLPVALLIRNGFAPRTPLE